MAVITVPIWDGGARYGVRRAAKADVTEAEAAIEGKERSATVELTQAERAVEVATTGRQLAVKARELARETKRLAEQAFDGGTGTSFEIVDASEKLRQAELAVALKELDVTRAKVTALLDTSTCDY